MDTLIKNLASAYVKYLDNDNGVYSTSHIYMHRQCRLLSEDNQKLYHEEIANIFAERESA